MNGRWREAQKLSLTIPLGAHRCGAVFVNIDVVLDSLLYRRLPRPIALVEVDVIGIVNCPKARVRSLV